VSFPSSPAQYGSAGWAKGQSEEEEKAIPIPDDNATPKVPAADYSEGWSVFRKAFFFGVIVTAVAVYLRYSRKKLEREDVGYEKNLA
jgi:hypothetical protein